MGDERLPNRRCPGNLKAVEGQADLRIHGAEPFIEICEPRSSKMGRWSVWRNREKTGEYSYLTYGPPDA